MPMSFEEFMEAFPMSEEEKPADKYLVQCEWADDGDRLKFQCRWCGGEHFHGAGEGWRMSHCEKCEHQYYLLEPKQ